MMYVWQLRWFNMQVKAVAEELGLGFAGIGVQPKWPVDAIPIMPKVSLHICQGH
jgi:glutamate--cysteine ligase